MTPADVRAQLVAALRLDMVGTKRSHAGRFDSGIDFSTKAWVTQSAVQRYGTSLLAGFDVWKSEHRASRREFPPLQYYMLHSLSHMQMTSISLECGYPAKFVIADSRQVFISSANFTEAAQQRNIEAGVLSENTSLAGELRLHFQSLIDHGYLKKLRWH